MQEFGKVLVIYFLHAVVTISGVYCFCHGSGFRVRVLCHHSLMRAQKGLSYGSFQ